MNLNNDYLKLSDIPVEPHITKVNDIKRSLNLLFAHPSITGSIRWESFSDKAGAACGRPSKNDSDVDDMKEFLRQNILFRDTAYTNEIMKKLKIYFGLTAIRYETTLLLLSRVLVAENFDSLSELINSSLAMQVKNLLQARAELVQLCAEENK